jgi:hypothetical protein
MFAVNGQQRDFMPGYGGHHDFSGGNENFFVGERDVLATLDRLIGGREADYTDGGGHDGLSVGVRGDVLDTLGPENYLGRLIARAIPEGLFQDAAKFAGGSLGAYRNEFGAMVCNLLGNKFDVRSCGESDDFEGSGKRVYNFEALAADRPSGAQNGNSFHAVLFNLWGL